MCQNRFGHGSARVFVRRRASCFVDFFLYNFLIGNADAHAKNFSLLTVDGKTSVAPLYDAMSTRVYPQVYGSMAMAIGGHYAFGDVMRASFETFARECDISPKAVFTRLDKRS